MPSFSETRNLTPETYWPEDNLIETLSNLKAKN